MSICFDELFQSIDDWFQSNKSGNANKRTAILLAILSNPRIGALKLWRPLRPLLASRYLFKKRSSDNADQRGNISSQFFHQRPVSTSQSNQRYNVNSYDIAAFAPIRLCFIIEILLRSAVLVAFPPWFQSLPVLQLIFSTTRVVIDSGWAWLFYE